MQNKITTLFDIHKLLPRPIPEQEKFERDNLSFLTKFPELVSEAYRITDEARSNKKPRSINQNWFANEMSGNLAELVSSHFPEYVSLARGTYYLNFNFQYECYVKRLTGKKLAPSYHHSKTSWANLNQRSISSDEIVPVIYIGYKANKSNDKILGCYAVCFKGKDRLWVSDLDALDGRDYGSTTTIAPQAPAPSVTPEVQVGVRAKRKAQ